MKRYVHFYVYSSIIYNGKDVEAIQVCIDDEWVKKMWDL